MDSEIYIGIENKVQNHGNAYDCAESSAQTMIGLKASGVDYKNSPEFVQARKQFYSVKSKYEKSINFKDIFKELEEAGIYLDQEDPDCNDFDRIEKKKDLESLLKSKEVNNDAKNISVQLASLERRFEDYQTQNDSRYQALEIKLNDFKISIQKMRSLIKGFNKLNTFENQEEDKKSSKTYAGIDQLKSEIEILKENGTHYEEELEKLRRIVVRYIGDGSPRISHSDAKKKINRQYRNAESLFKRLQEGYIKNDFSMPDNNCFKEILDAFNKQLERLSIFGYDTEKYKDLNRRFEKLGKDKLTLRKRLKFKLNRN